MTDSIEKERRRAHLRGGFSGAGVGAARCRRDRTRAAADVHAKRRKPGRVRRRRRAATIRSIACTACHNFKLVAQQGMSRRQWEEILQVMVDRHGMPPLDAKDRQVVLDYLSSAYPPRTPARGGWQNPFLNR